MSARLAECCRENPFDLVRSEQELYVNNLPIYELDPKTCKHEVFLSFFFDGTNNNKYRDLPAASKGASNIARLFEACQGHPAEQQPSYGGTESEPLLNGLPASEANFYRKVYIPGLGTAFFDIDDPGENLPWGKTSYMPYVGAKSRGLAMALYGEGRIRWALTQVINQVALALGGDTIPNEEVHKYATESGLLEWSLQHHYNQKLRKSLKKNSVLVQQGKIHRIRISVFGFSRGAAEARAFVRRLTHEFPNGIGGLKYEIDFMGLFDTVASVGVANYIPNADGHMAWADGSSMAIPSGVKRCVHLVSAHEVRRSFPLDAVGGSENCKEIVYPGVHSDVGGGYTLWDQGRCANDTDKISQITLAQMYREARMAGAPIAALKDMRDEVLPYFVVSPELRKTFNAYIERTSRTGKVVHNKMHLTETQPPQPLLDIMHDQYAHYLAWRKFRKDNIWKVEAIPGLANSPTKAQDTYDIWQANYTIVSELVLSHLLIKLHGKNGSANDDQFPGLEECREVWEKANLDPGKDAAIVELFDKHVHDSRAWFKLCHDSDDEWFGGGPDAKGKKRDSRKDTYRQELEAKRAKEASIVSSFEEQREKQGGYLSPYDKRLLKNREADLKKTDDELALYNEWGDTLLEKGKDTHEEIQMGAGYLRWRSIYLPGVSSKRAGLTEIEQKGLSDAIAVARWDNDKETLEKLYQIQDATLGAVLASISKARTELARQGADLTAFDANTENFMRWVDTTQYGRSHGVSQKTTEVLAQLKSRPTDTEVV
jgi:hypothetical protein